MSVMNEIIESAPVPLYVPVLRGLLADLCRVPGAAPSAPAAPSASAPAAPSAPAAASAPPLPPSSPILPIPERWLMRLAAIDRYYEGSAPVTAAEKKRRDTRELLREARLRGKDELIEKIMMQLEEADQLKEAAQEALRPIRQQLIETMKQFTEAELIEEKLEFSNGTLRLAEGRYLYHASVLQQILRSYENDTMKIGNRVLIAGQDFDIAGQDFKIALKVFKMSWKSYQKFWKLAWEDRSRLNQIKAGVPDPDIYFDVL